MSDTYGPTSGRQFAFYDHDSHSWKMWPDIGLWGSIEYSETLPKTGYMSGGRLYERATSERHIIGNVSSSLFPTPSVADAIGGHATRSGARSNELLLPGLVKTFVPT
jgi:hypothetical protein